MPGHVKKGGDDVDPDPKPYLVISIEMKRENAMKPYDPKKSYWAPDGKGGYLEGILDSDDGAKAVVIFGHEVSLGILSITVVSISMTTVILKHVPVSIFIKKSDKV